MSGFVGAQVAGSLLDRYISYTQARAMQDDMNTYNDPKHMIGRMQQAGLSPWNYSGEGNTSAQPIISESKLADSVGSVADRKLAERQLDIQENLSDAQAEQTRSLTETNKTLLKYLDESERERIDNMKASTGNLNASTAEIAKRVSRYDEQVDQDIKVNKAIESYQYAQTYNCKAQTNRINRLLSWEIKEASQRIKFSNAQIAVLKTQANLNTEQTKNLGVLSSKYKTEIKKLGVETWAQKHSNEIWQKCGVKPGTPAWTAVIDILGSVINQFSP